MTKMQKAVMDAARRVCGSGDCAYIEQYNCGHTNKTPFAPPRKMGSSSVCPLAKYKVQEEQSKKPFPFQESADMEDLAALCLACEHTDDKGARTEQDYYEYCIDCPVENIRDCMMECAAEAACS